MSNKNRAIILAAVLAITTLGTANAVIKTHANRAALNSESVQEVDLGQKTELIVVSHQDDNLQNSVVSIDNEASWNHQTETIVRGISSEKIKSFKFGLPSDPVFVLIFGIGLAIMAFACFLLSKT